MGGTNKGGWNRVCLARGLTYSFEDLEHWDIHWTQAEGGQPRLGLGR